jgi:hypothetical protein
VLVDFYAVLAVVTEYRVPAAVLPENGDPRSILEWYQEFYCEHLAAELRKFFTPPTPLYGVWLKNQGEINAATI